MAFCASCGAEAPGNFCPRCGAPIAAAPGVGANPGYAPQPGPGYVPAPAASGLQENVAGALCYLVGFITGILFLVLEPYSKNPRVRFHAFQSIFFHLTWIVFWIAMTILQVIFAAILPFGLHVILSLFSVLAWAVVGLGGFALWIFLMFRAYNNNPLVLPVIGPLAQKQAGV
jgi:uncharacterized membrane protein